MRNPVAEELEATIPYLVGDFERKKETARLDLH
jgi:hypothetical protein